MCLFIYQLLTSHRLVEEALNIIKDFNKGNPNIITGKRLVFDLGIN